MDSKSSSLITQIISDIVTTLGVCLSLLYNYYNLRIKFNINFIFHDKLDFKDGYELHNVGHIQITNTCKRVITITDIKIKIGDYEINIDNSNFDKHGDYLPYLLNSDEICNLYFTNDDLIKIQGKILEEEKSFKNLPENLEKEPFTFIIINNFGKRTKVKTKLTMEKILNPDNK